MHMLPGMCQICLPHPFLHSILSMAATPRRPPQVEGKPEQAMRCYKRALALDPSVATAGSDPRPSWLNNLLGALPEAAAAAAAAPGAGQAGKAPRLRGEDSAVAGMGRSPATTVRG